MSTLYERKEATDLPKESGYYHTDQGFLFYDTNTTNWAPHSLKSNLRYYPEYWLSPLPSPIPSMTQEQVSELGWEAHKYNHRTIDGMPFVLGFRVGWHDCEEYLSTNTLSLKQEVEGLKEKLAIATHALERVYSYHDAPNTHEDSIMAIEDIASTALNGITK